MGYGWSGCIFWGFRVFGQKIVSELVESDGFIWFRFNITHMSLREGVSRTGEDFHSGWVPEGLLEEAYERSLRGAVGQLKNKVENERIVFFPIDYSGQRDSRILLPLFTENGIIFTESYLDREKDEGERVYRRVITDPRTVNTDGAKRAVIFRGTVEQNTSGLSVIGGLVWALENIDQLGFETVYTMCISDRVGLTNFHPFPFYLREGTPIEGRTPHDVLKGYIPADFERLKDKFERFTSGYRSKFGVMIFPV